MNTRQCQETITLSIEGVDVLVIVKFDFTPALYGRTSGPAESCEEPAPEMIVPWDVTDQSTDFNLTFLLDYHPDIKAAVVDQLKAMRV